MENLSDIREKWRKALRSKWFYVNILTSTSILIIIGIIAAPYMAYVQARKGLVLNDILISSIPAQDVSWITFSVMYTLLFIGILYFLAEPDLFAFAVNVYTLVTIMRLSCIYVFPLDPPIDFIKLTDPLLHALFKSEAITKDLFFSGHTSTMFLLYVLIDNRSLKITMLIGTVIIGILVIVQHVHYTIDVLGAPVFVMIAYYIANWIRKLQQATLNKV